MWERAGVLCRKTARHLKINKLVRLNSTQLEDATKPT